MADGDVRNRNDRNGVAMKRLAEIEARLAAATPGPWKDGGNCIDQDSSPWGSVVSVETKGSAWLQYEVLVMSQPDTDLIAHATADLALLSRLVRSVADAACELFQEGSAACCGSSWTCWPCRIRREMEVAP